MPYHLIVTDRAGFEAARAAGLAGLAPTRAAEGDHAVVYLRDEDGFAATLAVREGGRVEVETICPPGDREPAAPMLPYLEARPPFASGEMARPDYDRLRVQIRARERGRPRPPGEPPNEAEKRPPIPKKLRRPE